MITYDYIDQCIDQCIQTNLDHIFFQSKGGLVALSGQEESHPLSDTLGRAFGPDVHEGPKHAETLETTETTKQLEQIKTNTVYRFNMV